MNFRLTIIVITFLNISLSGKMFSQKPSGKVLLLDYYEEVTNLKVIKDYKEKRLRYRYITVYPVENPNFDRQKKILDVNGSFKVTDTSKVIFLDGGNAKDIYLPFKNERLEIDTLISDSIVGIRLNNKDYILKPGQMVIDSIVKYKIEGERNLQITTRYSFENYGLIDKKNIFDYEKRKKIEENKNLDFYNDESNKLK